VRAYPQILCGACRDTRDPLLAFLRRPPHAWDARLSCAPSRLALFPATIPRSRLAVQDTGQRAGAGALFGVQHDATAAAMAQGVLLLLPTLRRSRLVHALEHWRLGDQKRRWRRRRHAGTARRIRESCSTSRLDGLKVQPVAPLGAPVALQHPSSPADGEPHSCARRGVR
jgi:hypothetical protein